MTLERDEGRDEGSVHSLAVLGKAEELKVYLNEHPGTNLNELDEFVRVTFCCMLGVLKQL